MEYRVGIDLGGTNVAVGVVDENKQIIARASIKTRPERMLDDVIYDIGCCVKEAVKKAGITLQDCVSVGIGSPGYCRAAEGLVVYANNLGWKNVPLCDELRQELGVPVRLSNDANCAALGEVFAGAAKGAKSAIMITLGTGVGGGVILNGKIYEGDIVTDGVGKYKIVYDLKLAGYQPYCIFRDEPENYCEVIGNVFENADLVKL